MSVRVARVAQLAGIAFFAGGAAYLHATRLAQPRYAFTGAPRIWWTMAFVGLLALFAYGLGLPEVTRGRRQAGASAIGAVALAELSISVSMLILGQALLPRFVLAAGALVIVPWLVVCAGFVRDGIDRAAKRDRVVVVGDWADAATLSDELERSAERPAQIVEVLLAEDAAMTSDGTRPLCQVVERGGATVVVLDRRAQADQSIVEQAALLHEHGVRIRTLSLFYEEWLGKLPISELERVSLMFDIGELHRIRYGRFKRVVDVCIAFVGLVVLTSLAPLVAMGNLVANRGPLFFRQTRVGKGGRPIEILKFRSMRTIAIAGGEWTAADDARITPFGRFLRRAHLDELPQVVNVLKGDLSIVGPRPEQPHYVAELSEKLPFYRLRHLVQPGLTGWAQVKFPYGASEEDALEKLQYEFYYLRHQRLMLDLRIVLRTVRSVLGREGR